MADLYADRARSRARHLLKFVHFAAALILGSPLAVCVVHAQDACPGTLPAGTTVTATLTAAQQQQQAALQTPAVPDGFDEVDANSWFSYNDAFDAGSYNGKQAAPAAAPQASPTSSNAPSSAQSTMDPNDTSDLLDNSDLGLFS